MQAKKTNLLKKSSKSLSLTLNKLYVLSGRPVGCHSRLPLCRLEAITVPTPQAANNSSYNHRAGQRCFCL